MLKFLSDLSPATKDNMINVGSIISGIPINLYIASDPTLAYVQDEILGRKTNWNIIINEIKVRQTLNNLITFPIFNFKFDTIAKPARKDTNTLKSGPKVPLSSDEIKKEIINPYRKVIK